MDFPSTVFKSRIRRELLGLFFTSPEARYYVRQLQAKLGVSVGSLHRELKGLEKMGVLTSEREANLRYYSAAKSYPLYNELKAIVSKTIGGEAILKTAVEGTEGIEVAFIYGSFASGSETAASDIDLFLLGEFDHAALNRALRVAELQLGREIDVTSMTAPELAQERRERTHFVETVLAEPRVFLIGDEDGLR